MNTSKIMTNKLCVLTASLAIAGGAAAPALLSSAAAQTATPQTQRAVISGRYQGLAFTVYGSGELGNFSGDAASTLRVSAHPQARILGAKWQEPNIVVAFRVDAPLRTVYEFHDRQITEQGFRRTAQNLTDARATATYERDDRTIELNLDRETNNAYRATIELGAGNANAAQGGTGAAQGAVGADRPDGEGLAQPVTQDLGRLNVRVIPAGATLPNDSGTPTTLVLQPYRGARNTTVNFTGNTVFLGYFTEGTLDQVYQDVDRQLRQQGFEPAEVNRATDGSEVTAAYQRNGARLDLDVELRDRATGGYRVVADLDDLVGRLDQQAGGNTANTATTGAAGTPGAAAGAPLLGYPYGGLRYDFYGPRPLGGARADANVVEIAAPPNAAQDVRVNREATGVRVLFESGGTLQQVYDHYHQQLTQQGFRRLADAAVEGDKLAADYARDATRVRLTIEREGGTAPNRNFDVLLAFTGAS